MPAKSPSRDDPDPPTRHRRRSQLFLPASGLSPDDSVWSSQLDEMVAVERLNQRAEDERREEAARRRGFVQGQVCAFLSEGYSRAAAARAAGIRAETLSRWCRQDPAFAAAARAAEDGRQVQPKQRRRRKMTAGVQVALLRLLQTGVTRAEAAAGVGISRQTFYTWFQRLPEFRDAVLAAEDAAALARLPAGLR
ncbi:MAG: hypothetical protein ACYCO3_10455 [Mycobacteriales bacterium]